MAADSYSMRRIFVLFLLACLASFAATRRSLPRSQSRDQSARSRYCRSCDRDTHGHIRRSAAARNEFRRQNPCPATGKAAGACPGYVIDHVIPLKRGRPDSPSNMQWQTIADAKAKDRWDYQIRQRAPGRPLMIFI